MDHPINVNNQPYVDEINERAGGELIIEYLGGPEVIPTFDQADAIRTGMIDMSLFCPMAYMEAFSPLMNCEGLSMLTAKEERASAAYDLWVEVFAKFLNARYLGQRDKGAPFSLFSNVPINKVDDLNGLAVRTMPLYEPFLAELGASTMTTPMGDLYTAMERGVVDAYMSARPIVPGFALHEVTKYMIEPAFFQMEGCRFMNLDSWNSLPPHLQDIITELSIKYELIGEQDCFAGDVRALGIFEEAGVETLTLPPEEAEKFLKIAYDTTWKVIIDQEPEYGPKFKEVLSK